MKNRKVTLIVGNGFPIKAQPQLRNAPCLCGSGKKAKHCCGADTRYFYSKAAPKVEDVEKMKREELKHAM